MDDMFFNLMSEVAKAKRLKQGHQVLKDQLSRHGLTHVSYAAINVPSREPENPLLAVTYSPEWQKHYRQSGYVNVDPIVRAGMTGILPIDWSSIDATDPAIEKFFGEAQEFKITRSGLSIPIRGRHNEFAMLSVTADVGIREWPNFKKKIIRDIMLLAYQFHDWALTSEGVAKTALYDRLTTREKECLRWKAMGKAQSETADLMGIRERTVKFHLEAAAAKLDASNGVHAIAKAVGLGLICIQ